MWHPCIAEMNAYEYIRSAIDTLDDALYQAELSKHMYGDKLVKRIELTKAILKGERDDLLK